MTATPLFTIIVATDHQRGIGIANTLPWRLPADLAHFKRTTSGHPVIMGRKTFDSIGRPLPNRRNIVITRNPDWRHEGVEAVASLQAAARLLGGGAAGGQPAGQPAGSDLAPTSAQSGNNASAATGLEAFIIGGAQIYAEALPLPDTRRLIVTEIDKAFDCDTFFPAIDPAVWRETAREAHRSEQDGFGYAFVTYERR